MRTPSFFKYISKSKKNLNMHNAEIYQKCTTVPRRDALECLEKYAQKIKWKNDGKTVLDIGSGDGSLTNILTKFLPSDCTRVVGSDISEKMVQFANKHYGTKLTNFIILDIEGDLPDEMRGTFNLVFSNFAFHWVQQQEIAFTNIYNLLTSGGTCLLTFFGYFPLYTIYRTLARQEKWKNWLKDVENFVTPYQDCQEPDKEVKKMMTSIGFSNIDVRCTNKSYVFSVEDIKNILAAVDPCNMPQDVIEEFQEDYLQAVKDLKLTDHEYYIEEGSAKTRMNYRLITVFAEK